MSSKVFENVDLNQNNNLQKNNDIYDSDEKPEASKFRTILPQIIASTVKNLLLLDLGLSVAFPTIVIPALRGTISGYENEILRFSDNQASWFGSIQFICQPIGSVLSGWVTDPLGRKKAMMVVNIPHICAWIILHYANSVEMMYFGAILLGLGVGFMEAPIITYVGEISQPSIRGILISCAGVAVTLGIFIVYSLGIATTWRTAAFICLSIPIITVVAMFFIPETPMWLLSKNREDEALKSLQWLRGWVSPKAVEKEFKEMQRYSENSNKCKDCQKQNITCNHPPAKLLEKSKELIRKRTLKAFLIVIGLFAIGQFSGILSMRPFMVQIFKAYNVPIDPSVATVHLGVIGLIANIVNMSCIHYLGKRIICLSGLIASLICCISLASFGEMNFPENYNSFEIRETNFESSYFPLIAFYLLCFWTNGCVTSIPWFLLSEVFPFKSRGFATGITAAINYSLGFISTKTYLNIDKGLNLKGTMWFYAVVNLLGLIFAYLLIPETENRTLEDIELHFADNSKKLWDNKIKKIDVESGVNRIDKIVKEGKTISNGIDNKSFVPAE